MTDIEDANYLFSEYGISVTGKKTLNKEKDIYAVKDDILLTLNTQLLEVYLKILYRNVLYHYQYQNYHKILVH